MAWTSEDDEELRQLQIERDKLAESFGRIGPMGEAAAGVIRKGTEAIDIAQDLGAAAKAIPGAITSGVAAQQMGRLGTKIGSKLPGPLKIPGMLIGHLAFRMGGAAVGTIPGELVTSALDDEALDFERLDSAMQENVAGETLGMGISGLGARGVVRRVQNVPLDPHAAAVAKDMSNSFRRSYNLMTPERRRSLGLDPEMGPKAVQMGGLTASQQRNSRILDLVHASASGSAFGGGNVAEFQKSSNILSREVALNIGQDVGPKLSQADLGQAIRKSARGELKTRKQMAIPYLTRLVTEGKGVALDMRTMDWGKLPFLKRWEGTEHWSVNQYRQARNQLTSMIEDPRTTPENLAEAQKAVTRLDNRVRRALPPAGVRALKQVQKIEKGIQDDFLSEGLISGMLKGEGSPRRFVRSLVSVPDHEDLARVMKVIPEPSVRDSLKRELIHETFRGSYTSGGGMSGKKLRSNIEEKVGVKTLDKIVGKDTRVQMEKLADYRELLESQKGRGEAGRMATSMMQWSTGAAALASAIQGKFGATLAIGLAALGGPGYASRLMTDPRTSRQLTKLYKNMADGKLSRVKATQIFRNIAPKVMDNAVVERIVGRGLVEAYDQYVDPEVATYFQKAEAADADPPEPVPDVPNRGASGGAFVEGPAQ
jgi:hypothetical protein